LTTIRLACRKIIPKVHPKLINNKERRKKKSIHFTQDQAPLNQEKAKIMRIKETIRKKKIKNKTISCMSKRKIRKAAIHRMEIR
jgi:hypothetical protein